MGLRLGSELPTSQSKESPISSPVVGVGSRNTNQTQTKGPNKHVFPKFKSKIKQMPPK